MHTGYTYPSKQVTINPSSLLHPHTYITWAIYPTPCFPGLHIPLFPHHPTSTLARHIPEFCSDIGEMNIMSPFMSFPHWCHWTKFITSDRVQTMQTGGLEPSPTDVSTNTDTKITIKFRFDISLCLFYSLPKGDNILLPQWSTAMVSGSKTARRFRHFGDGSPTKARTDFSPYKNVPT